MLGKRYKGIFDAYRKLPYIIYKQKYLIPQCPSLVFINYLIGSNNNIVGCFKALMPEMVNVDLINRANDPNQKQALIKLYFREAQKLKEKNQKELQQYEETYIKALLPPKRIQPCFPFVKQNKATIPSLQTTNQGKLALYYSEFEKQPQEVKEKYQKIADQLYQKKIQTFQKAKQKYQIPSLAKPLPRSIFLAELKQGLIDETENKKYSSLPEKTKQAYVTRCQQIMLEKEQKFLAFLKAHNLTPTQFNHIKTVCQQVQALKKIHRQVAKKIKKAKDSISTTKGQSVKAKLLRAIEDEQEQVLDEQQSDELSKDTQTKSVIQDEVEKPFQKSQDIDFDDQQIDIYQLRRLWNQKQQNLK